MCSEFELTDFERRWLMLTIRLAAEAVDADDLERVRALFGGACHVLDELVFPEAGAEAA